MSIPPTNNTPRRRATQTLDEAIARFSSPEQKRVALRKALGNHPQDERLHQEITRLNGPEAIRAAVTAGLFISYSRPDELFALDLTERLNAAGINAWMDMIHVTEDQDWDTEVERALARSGLMIAVLSPHVLTDDALTTERKEFDEQGKLILPVLHSHCEWRKPEFWLPIIDFTRDFDRGLHTLLQVLKGTLPLR